MDLIRKPKAKYVTFQTAFIYIAVLLVIHAIAGFFHLYGAISWFDSPMHIFGGFAVGVFAIALWYDGIEEIKFKGRFERQLKWWLVPLFVLSFVALIGICWEVYEFILDELFSRKNGEVVAALRQPNLPDTMKDFVLDLFGGVLALFAYHRK